MSKISITRALVELKTLDSRIQKKIDSSLFVSFRGQFYQPPDSINDAASCYQSINDLIKHRTNLKSAIISSNASTQVTICGQTITVAEAIETKSSIKHKKNLLGVLKAQYGDAIRKVENINAKARQDLEYKTSRDAVDKDKQQMSLEEFSNTYIKMHGAELFDPLKLNQKIEELESYITQFEQEVDYVLSEKNATTFIEV